MTDAGRRSRQLAMCTGRRAKRQEKLVGWTIRGNRSWYSSTALALGSSCRASGIGATPGGGEGDGGTA